MGSHAIVIAKGCSEKGTPTVSKTHDKGSIPLDWHYLFFYCSRPVAALAAGHF